MFSPSRDQVRDTFFGAWRKYRAGQPLAGVESLALDVILAHPEYHDVLANPARYRDKQYSDEANPFLHMSMHVALEEQLSIDQPPGIAQCFRSLVSKFQDRHEALHEALADTGTRAEAFEAIRSLISIHLASPILELSFCAIFRRCGARGQRVRNGQPDGGLSGDGRSPFSTMRSFCFSRSGSGIGTAEFSACV